MTSIPQRDAYDVVVIGAGPAGLAAAALTAGAGLATLLVDENMGPGGQVWRAITTTPVKEKRLLGDDYWAGQRLVDDVRASGAEILQRATVWSLDRTLEVGLSIDGGARLVRAKRIILATGALERPFPIPGWTLPGVMTAGAAQTMLKSSGLLPQGRVVVAGQGPLLWLLSAQILRMGGMIDLVLDTADRRNRLRALPHLPPFLTSPYFFKGLAMMREVRARTQVVGGVTSLAARGSGRVEALAYEAGGRRSEIPVDVLLLHQGVVPNVNLAMAAGVRHRWDDVQLCWVPELDERGESSVAGIHVAGDGAGIGGASVAVHRGRIAARAVIEALKPEAGLALADHATLASELARAERGRAFLDVLFQPARQFRIPADETVVCRCEEVTARDIRESVALGATGPNQLKAYRRTGMGPCQGRLCGLTVTELMAEARGRTPAEIGYYRLRAPVKPITLAELASLPKGEDATKAVVRG
ncbi:thioredoxin reductase/bacterioferritin-associated ferredoxin [Chelatococcus caeni]|uniref:Thioredoxin reductase/bacterioferritin-associated ferredoxin n=1 Tax=Chelatococcus caeni TaxID=1348468 RepID=A0A840BVG9_9HYPH|nr:NAD(P)/FAD-dependent oxidoreductase [Chelatococcus caeni]MBB4017471.1 thioredoxin reductase/bacterioferritin-associated ferredoxin [Chelatococcus caeni]